MRLRNIPGSEEVIENSEYVVHKPIAGCWQAEFPQKQELHIEIGMGKGKFIIEMAKQNPQINYVGIERYSSVLLRALQKLDDEERIPNLKFICMDAKSIAEVFAQGEVDKIYLNFSDPWPKERHAKRRLPSKEFLARYDIILSPVGDIEFKTDNRLLFDFAVEQVEETKWKIKQLTYDLHNNVIMMTGNVMTEYEEKFSQQGNPIHKYVINR